MVIETLEKIDQARVMVARLNYGEREWRPNHPPREDDPDVVIHEALRSAALEIARLTRELEAALERERRLREASFTPEMIEAVRFASGLFAAGEWGPVLAQAADRMEAFRTAALRPEAQGEDRWEDLVFGPIVQAYNEAHAAHPSDRSESDVG